MGTNTESFFEQTGIHQRHIAAPEQAASDLALPAAEAALTAAGLTTDDIGLIVMATITPDMSCPAGANFVQAKLKADQALTFDVAAGCSGFLFAMFIAQQYLLAGFCDHVLLVASDVLSRTVNWEDASSAMLWGDGAGAAVISRNGKRDHPAPRILSVHAHTDGADCRNLSLPGAGSRVSPITHQSVDENLHAIRMIQDDVSDSVTVERYVETCKEAVQAGRVSLNDVNRFITHQADKRIISALAEKFKVDVNRFYQNADKYGNCSAASLALALDEAVRTDAIRKNDLVCLTAVGGGLTWASALIKW